MQSCAVISRIQLIEAPYLNEFLYWYLNLGFDKVYFINTEPHFLNQINKHVSSSFEGKVVYLTVDKSVQNEPSSYLLALINDQVREEFILNVDSDEFLYIDPRRFNCIKEFINSYERDTYIFNWINVPCFETFSNSMLGNLKADSCKMSFNTTRKSLGRVSTLRSIDWHVMNGGKGGKILNPVEDRCFVFHFIVRSVSHQLLKQYHQSMGNFKDKNQRLLKNFLSSNVNELKLTNYPFRMLAIILLRRIVELNNIRESLLPLIRGIQETPAEHLANMESVRHELLVLLRHFFSDRELGPSLEFDEYLNVRLGLEFKLDIGRLPVEFSFYSDTEPLRLTMDRLYEFVQ